MAIYSVTGGDIYTGTNSTTATWSDWNRSYSLSMTTTGSTVDSVNVTWTEWNQIYTQSITSSSVTTTAATFPFYDNCTSTANGLTWTRWNDDFDNADRRTRPARRILTPPHRTAFRGPTEEERRARRLEEDAYNKRCDEEFAAAKLARERAERLLHQFLSLQQLEDLKKKDCFYVDVLNEYGQHERYRINRGAHGNVFQLDERGSIIRSFCVQPPGVPDADSMLAQKLFLESGPAERQKFWETANITTHKAEKHVPLHIPRADRRQYAAQQGLLH